MSFSAFDRFKPLEPDGNRGRLIKYSYVGLKRHDSEVGYDDKPLGPKDELALASDFGESLGRCLSGSRLRRWRQAVMTLEADPNFHDAELLELIDEGSDAETAVEEAVRRFELMSSGHSIVLLTVTKLVEAVDERSLVLLDEPEAHLHPPLLSAFIRALSDLIIDRNGVAIVATHSPVVLQEVPSSCVWKIERSGYSSVANRPGIETFGENVGTLTREVFGLEVTHTGFNQLLRDQLARDRTYQQAVDAFDGQLGGEAKGLLRAYIATERRATE